MRGGWESTFTSNWSGASGMQIGYAGQYPTTIGQGFTADPVHGTPTNPNGPNASAQPGPGLDVPVQIQETPVYYGADGEFGWQTWDIDYPGANDDVQTGHDMPFSPATHRGPDAGHLYDVYQWNAPIGQGVNFYGPTIERQDLHAWNSSATPAPNAGAFPAQSHEDTGQWPVPFDSTTVAPLRPVPMDTEKIPMRRLAEDDRPIYQYLAVPARNTQAGTTPFTPTYDSNTYLQPVALTGIPMMPRVAEDPWVSMQATNIPDSDYNPDPLAGMGV